MRSEHRESFREDQHFAETTAPRETGMADRTRIATPATLWLETADSVFKWYGAMFRLAFGLGPMDGRGDAQGSIASPAPLKPEEQSPRQAAPYSLKEMNNNGEAESPPVVVLHSVRTAPVKPRPKRPKRRKTASRGKTARTSKMSSVKRSQRRAA